MSKSCYQFFSVIGVAHGIAPPSLTNWP